MASVTEGVGYEVGYELGAALSGVLHLKLHGGEVDQGGLMDVDVESAAVALEHHRGLHSGHGHGADAGVAAAVEVRVEGGNPAHGRGLVDELVGVVVTGYPEGGEVFMEGELCQFVADNEVAEGILLGELIAEAEAVVEEAEADDYRAVSVCLCAECRAHGLAEVDGQFVVVVADVALLAPDSLPGVVYCCAGGAVEDEALAHLGGTEDGVGLLGLPAVHEGLDVVDSAFVADLEAKAAVVDDAPPVKFQGVEGLALVGQVEVEFYSLVG